jgi:hypothetical protein
MEANWAGNHLHAYLYAIMFLIHADFRAAAIVLSAPSESNFDTAKATLSNSSVRNKSYFS